MKNFNTKNPQLGYYLAGLIEGDGSIWTPKNRDYNKYIENPRFCITFHKKELPLFEHLKFIIGAGGIWISKTNNTCSYQVADTIALINQINLINGKFRTPKIYRLHDTIDHLNSKHHLFIQKLPLDSSDLGSNAWLAGFADADGCFYIKLQGKYSIKNPSIINNQIRCSFIIIQRKIDKLSGESCVPFMTELAYFFRSDLLISSTRNYVTLSVNTKNNHSKIRSYFDKFPLMSTKYLNYQCFVESLHFLKRGLSEEEINKVRFLKSAMNTNRTYFNWDHLNKFYS